MDKVFCPDCRTTLRLSRTSRAVYFSCPGCGRRFTLLELVGLLDDDLEELLAWIPVNRL